MQTCIKLPTRSVHHTTRTTRNRPQYTIQRQNRVKMTRRLTNSYNNIRENEMPTDEWLKTRAEKEEEANQLQKEMRLLYIKSIQSHIPSYCPECHNHLVIDDEQIYCPHCGLITQDSNRFIAGFKFHLPHGLRLG